MKWFKHDSDANADAKLRKVRIKYGMSGYGLYWYCLEHIVGNIELHNLTFELEHDSEILAFDTGINKEVIQEMMAFMVDLGLFEIDKGVITCLKIAKRLDQSMTSNPSMREKIKGIHALIPDKIMTVSCHSHDGVMQEEKRRDENRIDENNICEPSQQGSPTIRCPYSKIVNLYHSKLPMLPKISRLNDDRKTKIRARWKDELPNIEEWDAYFDYISKSKFLTGRSTPNNGHKPFMPTIDWFINPKNLLKIEEGKYHG